MIKTKLKYKTKKIAITDFSVDKLEDDIVQDKAKCVSLYNFDVSGGTIKKGLGVRRLMVYDSNDFDSVQYGLDYKVLGLSHFNKVMHFKQYFPSSGDTTHRLLIHGSDGKLYLYQMFSNLNTPNWAYELQFDSIPAVLEYKKDGLDSILISSTDKLVVWSTGKTPYEITGIPTITSMCVCNDELFCTIAGESDKIWYTSSLDPEKLGVESDETKFLIMEGSAGDGRKIVKLKENMYVFCDYGIGRINTYANDEPTYNQIYLTNGQICPNSVVVCGDFVMFLTRDGLYRFNGASVTRIYSIDNLLRKSFNDNAVATVLNDYYYLALNVDFGEGEVVGCEFMNEYVNNVIVKLDINDYSFEIIRGVDVKDMLALKAGVDEKVVLTFNTFNADEIGEICDEGQQFGVYVDSGYITNYISPENFQPITIRKININSSGVVAITIITDKERFTFFNNADGVISHQTIIPCNKFKLKIKTSDSQVCVRYVEIEYETQI